MNESFSSPVSRADPFLLLFLNAGPQALPLEAGPCLAAGGKGHNIKPFKAWSFTFTTYEDVTSLLIFLFHIPMFDKVLQIELTILTSLGWEFSNLFTEVESPFKDSLRSCGFFSSRIAS